MRPGDVEARAFEYIRHGTQTLSANLAVATGRIVSPTVQATRTEADFAEHIRQTVARDPSGSWICITEHLNTQQSETLVRYVAAACNIEEPWGIKGQSSIVESMKTRAAFLENPNHRIRLVYTPKHASWLNQVEIRFSILVRRVLRRGHFTSTEALRQRLLDFIEYFTTILAKPFKWTYAGRPLTV